MDPDNVQHSPFAPDARCYHFAAQNVFLSSSGPSHFGMAGMNRIYLIYELQSKLEIYKYFTEMDRRMASTAEDEAPEEVLTAAAKQKDEFVLERTVQLHDVDIVQVQYCHLMPEYFVLLVNDRLTRLRSVRVYTNFMVTTAPSTTTESTFKIRQNGELVAALTTNSDCPLPTHLEHLDGLLNLIDFQHADISTLANYVHCCQASGNLVISIANGTTLIYQFSRLTLPTNLHHVAVDFILTKSITILDGWVPEIAKLSLNYVALMSQTHFSLLQIVFRDSYEYEDGHHRLEYKHDPKYHLAEQTHLIYNRLFDEPLPAEALFGINPTRQQTHADTVWGPVGEGLGCQFAVHDHTEKGQTKSSHYKLLFCRQLNLPKQKRPTKGGSSAEARILPNDLRTIRGKSKLCAEQKTNSLSDAKVHLFGFELLPYRDHCGIIFAHVLYTLWDNQLECYLVDVRRDKYRLVPISHVDISKTPSTVDAESHQLSGVTIRDFTANPQEDLVHVLLDGSFDTYATHLFAFLVSEERENLYCSRPVADMYQISSHVFFNVIAALSSPEFVFLISAEEGGRHTIYNLRRPTADHLQADILSALDDIRSNSDDNENPNHKHSFHRLYLRLLSIIKFALHYPMRSHSLCHSEDQSTSRIQCLEQLLAKISAEVQEFIEEPSTCNYPGCPFATRENGNGSESA